MASTGRRSPRKYAHEVPLPDTPLYQTSPQPYNESDISPETNFALKKSGSEISLRSVDRSLVAPTNSPSDSMYFTLDLPEVMEKATRQHAVGSYFGSFVSEPSLSPITYSPSTSPGKENISRAQVPRRYVPRPLPLRMNEPLGDISDDEDISFIAPTLQSPRSPKRPTVNRRVHELRDIRQRRLPEAAADTMNIWNPINTSDSSDEGSTSTPVFTPSPATGKARDKVRDEMIEDQVINKKLQDVSNQSNRHLEELVENRLRLAAQRIAAEKKDREKAYCEKEGLTYSPPYGTSANQESIEVMEESDEFLLPLVYDPNVPITFCRDASKKFQSKKLNTSKHPLEHPLPVVAQYYKFCSRTQDCAYCLSGHHDTACCSELFPPLGIKPHRRIHSIVFHAEHMLLDAYAKKVTALRQLLNVTFTLGISQVAQNAEGCDFCGHSSHSLFMCTRLFPFLDFKIFINRSEGDIGDSELVSRYASQMGNFRLNAQRLLDTINGSIRKIGKSKNVDGLYNDLVSGSQGIINVAHLKAATHGIRPEKIAEILKAYDKKQIMRDIEEILVTPSICLLNRHSTPDVSSIIRRARVQINEDEHDIIATELDRLANNRKSIASLEGEEGIQFRECVLALRTELLKNRINAQSFGNWDESKFEERCERKAVENALLRAQVMELTAKVESLEETVSETQKSLMEASDALPVEKHKPDTSTKESGESSAKSDGVAWYWWR